MRVTLRTDETVDLGDELDAKNRRGVGPEEARVILAGLACLAERGITYGEDGEFHASELTDPAQPLET